MPHNHAHLDPIDAFLRRIVPYGGIDTSPSVRALLERAAAKSSGRHKTRPDRPAAAQASLLPPSTAHARTPKQDQKV